MTSFFLSTTFLARSPIPLGSKTRHWSAYQQCNSDVECQMPLYLSQKNQMYRTLQDVPTFAYQMHKINY